MPYVGKPMNTLEFLFLVRTHTHTMQCRVPKVPVVSKAFLDLWDSRELLDSQEREGHLVQREGKVVQASMENLELLEEGCACACTSKF